MKPVRIRKSTVCMLLILPIVFGNETLAQETASPNAAPAVSLKALIDEAIQHNPEIKAMQRNFDMMQSRIPQAGALPDPMIDAGYMGNVVPIPPFDIQKGDPSSARVLSFSQELPFPGKRSLRTRMAGALAESEWWAYEQTRLEVIADLKDAYYDLYYSGKAIEILTKNKQLLERFAKIAEARYSVGSGIQQDVLKAQVEISKLVDRLTVLEQQKHSTESRINSLLYRDTETPVGKAEEIRPQEFHLTVLDLNGTALANNPTLKMLRRKLDRETYGIELAEKEYYPDVTVGVSYWNRPGLPEMFGVSIGVKVPLYFWRKQRPAVAEAAASAAAERKRLESMTTLVFFKIKDRYLAAVTAQKLVTLYGTTIIPQSTLALESAIAGYEVGKLDFLSLLDSLVTLLNYELSYYEQLGRLEKAIAGIEPLAGVSLSR
jgi:outer membrane protein TolC